MKRCIGRDFADRLHQHRQALLSICEQTLPKIDALAPSPQCPPRATPQREIEQDDRVGG
jgi:hypothetical protein